MVTPGFSYQGQDLAFVPMPWSATFDLISGNLRRVFERMLANTDATSAAAIPVERIRGPILLVSATTDEFWPSMEMSNDMMLRLREHQFAFHAEHWPITGGRSEPLDEFPLIEAFLRGHFAANVSVRECD